MRIYHLNCVSMCPLGGGLMDGRSSLIEPAHLVCHCLLVEAANGLVLVDTGFGTRDVESPKERLSSFFRAQLHPDLRYDMTAKAQIECLGFKPVDVRHILLTHLDFDHAGGLDDFPAAAVHLLAAEREAAMKQATWLDRGRFRPAQWRQSAQRWQTYTAGEGETWFGFSAVRAINELKAEFLLVPLIGHTLGHAGIAVRGADGWLLHAGDAYFHEREMESRPTCPPGLRYYQWQMEKKRSARLWNQRRLRKLKQKHGSEVTIFCAHDAHEFDVLARAEAERPKVATHARTLAEAAHVGGR